MILSTRIVYTYDIFAKALKEKCLNTKNNIMECETIKNIRDVKIVEALLKIREIRKCIAISALKQEKNYQTRQVTQGIEIEYEKIEILNFWLNKAIYEYFKLRIYTV